jgi:6-phosphogluconolactonase (cycloisomerase 2 family)
MYTILIQIRETLVIKNTTDNVINPSYLTVSKDNKFIYSVNEFETKVVSVPLLTIQIWRSPISK